MINTLSIVISINENIELVTVCIVNILSYYANVCSLFNHLWLYLLFKAGWIGNIVNAIRAVIHSTEEGGYMSKASVGDNLYTYQRLKMP